MQKGYTASKGFGGTPEPLLALLHRKPSGPYVSDLTNEPTKNSKDLPAPHYTPPSRLPINGSHRQLDFKQPSLLHNNLKHALPNTYAYEGTGQGSQYQSYQPMGGGFHHHNFQPTALEQQSHNFDYNSLAIQHQPFDPTIAGFQNPSYHQMDPGAQYQAYQYTGQVQYGMQQPADRYYGGQQFSSFNRSKNHFNDFIPGNIAHQPAYSSSYPTDRQAPNQITSQSLNQSNAVPEQRGLVSAQEHNLQYSNRDLIQNLHQSFSQSSQQSSLIVGQSDENQKHENSTTSANYNTQMAAVETPRVPYSGLIPFKKPTPYTAPPSLGSETPTPNIHARRAQTVSRMRLDAARGPSTFWRSGKTPVAVPIKDSALVSSAVKARPQVQPHSSMTGAGGLAGNDDPFIDREYDPFPEPMQMTMTVARDVYQPKSTVVVPQAGPIVPMIIGQQVYCGPSEHLAQICPNGAKPSIETALAQNNLPFIEIGRQSGPVFFGVLRISNIPYSTSRAEVIAFLGRNARIINESIEPVHIIMDRVSGKTEEVFVEFISLDEVINAVRRYENNRKVDRGGLVGDRHVTLEVSSQEQLMERLFPRAKNVRWDGAQPVIMPCDPGDIYNSGFKGFVNQEEMVMLIKHVEHPSRTPFSRECPQRPFECLISTLVKYPWYMSSYITISDRDIIYDGTITIIKQLMHRVSVDPDHITINGRLLKRLFSAALCCPGFTEMQKDNIAFVCNIKEAGLAPYADHWHVFRVLGPRHGVAPDVLLYYMALIREGTTSPEYVSLAEQAAMTHHSPFGVPNMPCVFGNFRVQYPPDLKDYNMAQIGEIEWNAIDRVLRKILGSTQPTHAMIDAE